MRRISAAILCLIALALPLSGIAADSQPYPNRPVRVVMPYPPGGGTDITGRIIAQGLAKALGQPFVVDNRGGAGGTIGTDIVAKAPRDGYTMLVSTTSLAVNASLYPKLPYDTLKDLDPLMMVGQQPNVLIVHAAVPANSIRELLDLTKGNATQLNYASGGAGSSTYLAMELLKYMTKAEIAHVPYRGVGPAMTALLSGQVQLFFSTLGPALPHIKSGRVRALGVTSLKRSPYIPNVPTISEAGVPGYEYATWYGIWLPAGTPRVIANRLFAETEKIVLSPETRDAFVAQSVDPLIMPADKFAAFCRAEVDKWAKIIRVTGAKPE